MSYSYDGTRWHHVAMRVLNVTAIVAALVLGALAGAAGGIRYAEAERVEPKEQTIERLESRLARQERRARRVRREVADLRRELRQARSEPAGR